MNDFPPNHPFYDATATPPPTSQPPAPGARRRSLGPGALVLAVSVLSSALASGITAVALVPGLVASAPVATPADEAPVAGSGATVAVTPAPIASTGSPIVDVAARVGPAVVTITASGQSGGRGPFNMPSTGVGSGVIFRADGWILTNAHVVEGAMSLVVTLKDGRELPGTVVEIDEDSDLAAVRVEASGLPAAELGRSADLEVGELVIAIGSPLGEFTDSVTSGILSAIGRTIEVPDERGQVHTLRDLLQTDAAINPGNSGGPLLDADGRVIGINTAIAGGANGIGFAIPIDKAAEIIEQAVGSTTI